MSVPSEYNPDGKNSVKLQDSKHSAVVLNYSCKKCKQPLKLDSSFESISPHTYADITSPIALQVEEPAAGTDLVTESESDSTDADTTKHK